MSEPMQERIVDGITTVPFISVFGINFLTLNQFLETITLLLGIIAALFSVLWHIRRWWQLRKEMRKAAEEETDDE